MLDELVAGGAVVVLLEAVDVDAEPADDEAAHRRGRRGRVAVELEWLLEEPHAATSSASASATQIRFSIGSG